MVWPALPLLLLFVTSFISLTLGQRDASSLSPFPLAVRSPYLNFWLPNNRTTPGNDTSPILWNQRKAAWSGIIRVDGRSWVWLGNSSVAGPRVEVSHSWITPTKTILQFEISGVVMNVTFLSPVEPNDYVWQSFPFSHVYADVVQVDGHSHEVQLYTDVEAGIITNHEVGDSSEVQWNTTRTSKVITHSMRRVNIVVREGLDSGLADDLVCHLAFPEATPIIQQPNVTFQTGENILLREQFSGQGRLNSSNSETRTRDVEENNPTIAFAYDLGQVAGSQVFSTHWAFGITRDPIIIYQRNGLNVRRRAYFWTKFGSMVDAIEAFLDNFIDSRNHSDSLDKKITDDAMQASGANYADLVSLSLRQTLASLDITVGQNDDGSYDTSDVLIFMKDIGSTSPLRVNPVETMYGALPALLYLNPDMAAPLLKPLLEVQNASHGGNRYAVPDLGQRYPIALGNSTDTEVLGYESTSSMLIMVLLHALKSGDTSLIEGYIRLLTRWAIYLEPNILLQGDYGMPISLSADGLNAMQMPNIVIKGILATYARIQMDSMIHLSDLKFSDIDSLGTSSDLYLLVNSTNQGTLWDRLMPTGHIVSKYSRTETSGLIYNLYPARLMQTNLIPNEVFQNQTQFYASQLPTAPPFNLDIDIDSDSPGFGKPAWTMFTAAVLTNSTVSNAMINNLHARLMRGASTVPSPAIFHYDPSTGEVLGGAASPLQGGLYAMLALKLPNRIAITTDLPPGNSQHNVPSHSNKLTVKQIVGILFGSLVSLLLIFGALLYWCRKSRRSLLNQKNINSEVIQEGPAQTSTFLNFTSRPTIFPFPLFNSDVKIHDDHHDEAARVEDSGQRGPNLLNFFNNPQSIISPFPLNRSSLGFNPVVNLAHMEKKPLPTLPPGASSLRPNGNSSQTLPPPSPSPQRLSSSSSPSSTSGSSSPSQILQPQSRPEAPSSHTEPADSSGERRNNDQLVIAVQALVAAFHAQSSQVANGRETRNLDSEPPPSYE